MARPREFDEEKVITRATQLFWELGYRRTTPQNLLEVTGLSKSSLYATFGSKQGLFELCLKHYVHYQEVLLRQVLSTDTLREALTRYLLSVLSLITSEDKPSVCLVASSAIELGQLEPNISPLITEGRERFEAVIEDRIKHAQEVNEISQDRSSKALARYVYGTNLGLIVMGRAGASTDELKEVIELSLSTVCG